MNEALKKELEEYKRVSNQLDKTRWRIQELVSKGVDSYFPGEKIDCYSIQETSINEEDNKQEEFLHVTVEFEKCKSADLDKLWYLQQALGAINLKVGVGSFLPTPIDEEDNPTLHLDFYLPISE